MAHLRSSEYAAGRVTPDRTSAPAGESPHTICGLPPSVAEFLLEQALTAFGGVHGLVKKIDEATA